jgi:DNA-binding IclR family transcriptional regulator
VNSYWRRRQRMQAVLQVLGVDARLDLDQLKDAVKVSRATMYRYIAELKGAGLIEDAPGGSYRASAQLRHYDATLRPMLAAAAAAMRLQCGTTGMSQLVCASWKGRVYAVDAVGDGWRDTKLRVGGVLRHFDSVPALAVTAWRADRDIRRLLSRPPTSVGGFWGGLGWRRAQARLAALREQGYCLGPVDSDGVAFGVAAPITAGGEPIGSITTLPLQGGVHPLDDLVAGTLRTSASAARAVATLEPADVRGSAGCTERDSWT